MNTFEIEIKQAAEMTLDEIEDTHFMTRGLFKTRLDGKVAWANGSLIVHGDPPRWNCHVDSAKYPDMNEHLKPFFAKIAGQEMIPAVPLGFLDAGNVGCLVLADTTGRYFSFIQPRYYGWLLKNFCLPSFFITRDARDPIQVVQSQERIAVVMPINPGNVSRLQIQISERFGVDVYNVYKSIRQL